MPKLLIFLSCLLFSLLGKTYANQEINEREHPANSDGGQFRVSILIGGPSEELWETFGHSCIRVIDSSKTGAQRDLIYNYGFFSVENGSIGKQFLTGPVQVFIDTITFDELEIEYTIKKRRLTEQVLTLTNEQKLQIVTFLKNNMLNDTRFYEYNTFFDNCTTRIYDLFVKVFGRSFVIGEVVPPNPHLTFREVSFDKYCPEQSKYWFGLGLNLFYAGSIDHLMYNKQSMCLPEYLNRGFTNATINGLKIGGETVEIFKENIKWEQTADGPFIVSVLIFIATLAGIFFRKLQSIGIVIHGSLVFISGILGCFMVYLWLLNGEPAWNNNLNVLWALPTNIIYPFLKSRFQRTYSLVGLILIAVSFIIHFMGIQVLPFHQIGLLLLSLICGYAFNIRRNSHK